MRSKSGNVGAQPALHPAGQGRHEGRPANVAAGLSEEPREERQPASPTATTKGLFCWGEGDHNHPLPAQHGADARLMLAAPYWGGWAPVKADPGVQDPGRQPASQAAAAKGLPCWGEGDHNHPLPT